MGKKHDEHRKDDTVNEAVDHEALEHPSYEALEAKLTEMENKANDYWNQYLRAQAELENNRRRVERDISNAHKYGLEKIASELLGVVDSMERGLAEPTIMHEAYKSMREGMELTLNMLLKVLDKFGIKPVDPQGQPFNPELHQAVSTVVDPKVQPNTVIQVLQKGYLLQDRLLRPALVVVSKAQ